MSRRPPRRRKRNLFARLSDEAGVLKALRMDIFSMRKCSKDDVCWLRLYRLGAREHPVAHSTFKAIADVACSACLITLHGVTNSVAHHRQNGAFIPMVCHSRRYANNSLRMSSVGRTDANTPFKAAMKDRCTCSAATVVSAKVSALVAQASCARAQV